MPVQIHGNGVRFGLHSGQQYTAFGDVLELWQRAEELGFDWASVFDHFRPPMGGPDGPCFEGTTLLAALAARTTRIRCALLVSAVTWRHPTIAAALAATIDNISGGRLEFGVGAAGPDLAYQQYGIPFPQASARLDLLDEACRVMRSLWTARRTDFSGTHLKLTRAYLEPKPVQAHLPLIIGGEGKRRMLGIIAEHADIWNTLAGDPARYQRKVDALARHCAARGRDPGTIRRSVTFRAMLAEDEDEALERAARFRASVPSNWPDLDEYLVFGTPQQCVESLLPFYSAGVRDFILGARPPIDWQTVELVASQVAPALRARVGAHRERGGVLDVGSKDGHDHE
jgi:alkanesulfonate monooxygenase SsuD/methylene tetrahydromethanopterin reductase-like flavin-dependent oxidoreductase (luciferase family)